MHFHNFSITCGTDYVFSVYMRFRTEVKNIEFKIKKYNITFGLKIKTRVA